MVKRIGILTSGGDAPGMNAAIRAVVRTAIYHRLDVIGIKRGYCGLINGEYTRMNLGSVADIIHRGGTVLGTARCEEFYREEGRHTALEKMREAGIDGLVAIGGDGTFRGAVRLNEMGMPTIGVPGTIDNDIPCTDRTIGFDTVVNTVTDAINKIRDTATSHERIFIIEVMGRNSGCIALAAGLAGGAESILIPEIPLDLNAVVENIKRGKARGKRHSIIILAEGVAHSLEITEEIRRLTGMDTRLTILGYLQRGGSPTAQDRILASRMGAEAVRLLMRGEKSKMVAAEGDQVKGIDLEWVLSQTKEINYEDYRLAGVLSI
ncbi:MAG: 6-phosphofructokinase [Peptococcaceae bacterium]|nr:6-phosphofructokinase [Peptococcaceae bacterium]MDH7524684.1 6-phosphofructokinase [Peptococcaceae bacterium]